MKPEIKLSKWKITDEYGYYHLIGKAHNHPRLGSTLVATSRLINVDFQSMKAETLNSIYLLVD